MEQPVDAFAQRRMELMIEMATKKLQQELSGLKEYIVSLNSEVNSLKSQVNRLQFQPQQTTAPRRVVEEMQEEPIRDEQPQVSAKKEVKIVDCRPDQERKTAFVSGAARNSEPVRPRFGDYKSEDVSIDKFFYFGRK